MIVRNNLTFVAGDSVGAVTNFHKIDLLSNEEMMATEGEWLPLYLAYYYGPTIGMYGAMGISLYSRYNMGTAFSSLRNRFR